MEPPAEVPPQLPYSRPFALAGFGREQSEAWRRAGWTDPAEAARWRDLAAWCTPGELLDLAEQGHTPAAVARACQRFLPFTDGWVRSLGRPGADEVDVEIDLRDRVLENLHLGRSPRRPSQPSERTARS
jgi:hypothetical protein